MKTTTPAKAKQPSVRIRRDSIAGEIDGTWYRIYVDVRRSLDTNEVVSATAVSIHDEHGNDISRRISSHVLVSHVGAEPHIERLANGDTVSHSNGCSTYW